MGKQSAPLNLFLEKAMRFFRKAGRLFSIIYRKFNDDLCVQGASALTFNTLLSMVPLFTLVFAIITSMEAFQGVEKSIKQFVFDRFIPSQAEVLEQYIEEFSKNVQAMNALSIIGVLLAGVFLLVALENFLNKIWQEKKRRGFVRSVINYWTVLTLGPVFLGASFYITEFMKDYAITYPVLAGLIGFTTSFLLNTALMFLMYFVMPFHKVKIRAALGGALFSGFCYEILRNYFSEITSRLNYEKIYGALAILPIFLFWIYLIWITILIGAEISYYIQYPPLLEESNFDEKNLFVIELGVFFYIVKNYLDEKENLHSEAIKARFPEFDPELIFRSIVSLIDRKLILKTDERGYIPYHEPVKQNLGMIINNILGIKDPTITETLHNPQFSYVMKELNIIVEKHFQENVFDLLDPDKEAADSR
ncbi:MAG: hypothetical protein A2Y33_00470 [Spirochaetes bacterium GWF1_51_8]|nr:MAG: hypothetical protein A2Y33_00470 [Spirochaetes bacterium GWF1_51_8]